METFDTVNTFNEEDAHLFDSLLDDVRVVRFMLLVTRRERMFSCSAQCAMYACISSLDDFTLRCFCLVSS